MHTAAMRYQVMFAAGVALVTSCKSEVGASGGAGSTTTAAASATTAALEQKTSAPLNVGDPAPDVTLVLQNGKAVKTSELRGKAVVLYFYPKDDTPGCRVEAQGFRDAHAEFVAANALVFGVSTQDEASHQAFIQKENLPFDLVIDADGKVASAFGIRMMGSLTSRQTVLIDSAGKVAAKWVEVTPKAHAAEVLAAIKMSEPTRP